LWGTPLQRDAGLPVGVEWAAGDGILAVSLETDAAGAIVQIDGGEPIVASLRDGRLVAELAMPANGPHLLVVTGLTFGVKTAYRSVGFEVSSS